MTHEVGGLEARLSLNADDFEFKIAKANEEADKIDGKHVSVKVSADVAQALAEMDAVDAKAAEMQAQLDAASAASMSPSDQRLRNVAAKAIPEPTGITSQAVDNSVTEKAIQDAKDLADAENRLQLAYRDLDMAERAGLDSKQQLATLTDRLLEADRAYTTQAGATAGAENDVTHALDARFNASRTLAAAEQTRIGILGEVAQAEGATADATGKASENANKAADAVGKLSEAQKKSAETAQSSAGALKVAFTGVDALLASVPLLIGVVDALGSSLLATGGAFITMAAAGALAFAGIREEIANGTNEGRQFDAGLQLLRGDMDQLARTSAVAMLDGFQRSVAELNAAMPEFNTLASVMSSTLGSIGAELIGSLIGGLEKMEPLLIEGAQEFGKFANFLLSWDQGNGFTEFMNTAMTSLPQVTTLLEGLITLVEHIFQAFQPLAPVVLTFVNALLGIANAIPLPVLAGMVTFALEIKPAMSLAGIAVNAFASATKVAATSVTIFGLAANLTVPVLGIILAAVGALAIGFASMSLSQQQATVSATDYAQALQQDNNAIGQNVNAMAAKNLADSGAIDAASRLGIASEDLIGYIDGNTAATNRVNAAMNTAKGTINDVNQSYVDASSGVVTLSDHQKSLQSDMNKVNKALNDNKTALDQEQTAQTQAAQATQDGDAAIAKQQATLAALGKQYGLTAQEIQSAAAAHHDYTDTVGLQSAALQALADKYNTDEGAVQRDIQDQLQATGAFSATTLQMQIQNDAAGLLKSAFDNLNNSVLNVDQAQNQAQTAIENATAALAKNGADVTSVDSATGLYTSSVLLNRTAIDQAASAAQQHAEAVAKSTGSVQAGQATMATDRASMIASASQQGILTQSVQDYINKVFQIPPSANTQVTVDANQALATIANVGIALDNLNGKTAVTTITTINDTITQNQSISTQGTNVGNNGAPQAYAWGGRVARMAIGGQNPFAYGTDDVPAMLSADEEVIPRGSSNSMRSNYPGYLEYIRSHGAPPPSGGTGPIYLTAYFQNPFTGDQVQATVRAVAVDTISQAVNGAVAMRPGA